jgi:hypothetical protein
MGNGLGIWGYSVVMERVGGDASTERASGNGVARGWVFRWLPRFLTLLLACVLVWQGLRLREWVFTESAEVRFRWDFQNGLNQGARVLRNTGLDLRQGEPVPLGAVYRSLVRTYDEVYQDGNGERFSLDYTPLRLAVMTMWVRGVYAEHGPVGEYDDRYAGPLMTLNAWVGVATGGAMYLLVSYWGRRVRGPVRLGSGWWRDFGEAHGPMLAGLTAGSLAFFNPAALINAHAFPQWDTWLLPFFLLACYAGSRGSWFVCGFMLVLGAFFKGQVLLVAPVLLAWPLLRGNVGGFLRVLGGAATGVAMVAWPWLLRFPGGWTWVGVAAGSVLVVWGVCRCARGLPRWRRAAVVLLTVTVGAVGLIYPALPMTFPSGEAPPVWWMWALAAAVPLGLVCAVRSDGRTIGPVVLATAAVAALGCGFRFGGVWSWYEVGFEFPTRNYMELAMGPTANLPAILGGRYGWQLLSPTFALPGMADPMPLRLLLRLVYAALLVIPCVAVVRADRRSSAAALMCITVPWVVFFAVLPQMHERYLVWAAVVSAAPAAMCGLMGLLVHAATTFFAFACIATQILRQNPERFGGAHDVFAKMIPDAGWGVMLLAVVCLAACWGGGTRARSGGRGGREVGVSGGMV